MKYIKQLLKKNISFKELLILFFMCALSIGNASADDIEIYEHGGCAIEEKYRFIFVVDNSGSMDRLEFIRSQETINASISYVLNSGLSDIEVAVVQYGSSGAIGGHYYNVTVPFTSNESIATAWRKAYGIGGTVNHTYKQDHQPASLARMRLERVYDRNRALDVSDATNVQFVFFTDAKRDNSRWNCCTSIVADSRNYIGRFVKYGFGEYDALKNGSVLPNGLKAQFTVLHAGSSSSDRAAGAAIASAGGEYVGRVESNSSDPDGAGEKPRRYILGDFSVSDTTKIVDLLDSVFEEITAVSTLASPSVSASAFNDTRSSDRLYYSMFQPGQKRSWEGNLKGYRLSNAGVVVDVNGIPALDADTGSLRAESRSLWSAADDGHSVTSGGSASKLTAPRKWYTDAPTGGGVALRLVETKTEVDPAVLGASTSIAERDLAVNWALGYDSLDLNKNNNNSEASHYLADSLHSSPKLVNFYRSDTESSDVLFSASNQGMLHAIEPETGEELWSYMPAELLPNLLTFNNPRSDINDHNYGLDGPLSFYRKEETRTSTATTLNKGFLYLSQRRGGSNIFALNVSNARAETEPFNVAWKINGGQGDFIDLAQTWAKPEIITVNLNCDTACERKDVLLISGGYNPAYDDPSYGYPTTPAGSGHGNALYMVDPETGALLWSVGKRNAHDLVVDMRNSFPSAPVSIDTDGNGGIDVIYATDIAGGIWRIDLDPNASSFSDLHIAGGRIADLAAGLLTKPRFFNRPDVVMSQSGSSAAHFNIIVGSGMRSSPLTNETGKNAIYFLRDPWVKRNPVRLNPTSGELEPDYKYVSNSTGGYRQIERGDLIKVSNSGGVVSYPSYGFYEELEETGEKILAPTVTIGGKTLIITYVPPSAESGSTNSCAYSLGVSRLYAYDVENHQFVNIKSSGAKSVDIAPGIVSQSVLLDTGSTDGPVLCAGLSCENLNENIVDINTGNIRRIMRTSWTETEKK